MEPPLFVAWASACALTTTQSNKRTRRNRTTSARRNPAQFLGFELQKEAYHKKMGPPLGIGSPERCISFPASFSHRSVGSSILASLSEAGGNDPRKPASKPLPPRFANSCEPSTETHPTSHLYANAPPSFRDRLYFSISLQTKLLASRRSLHFRINTVTQFRFGIAQSLSGMRPGNADLLIGLASVVSSGGFLKPASSIANPARA